MLNLRENTQDFSKIYDKYVRSIFNFIYYKTFHKETAEDLTSETFLKALRKFDSYDSSKAPVSAWLYQIARNTVIDYYRAKRPNLNIEDIWDLSGKEDIFSDIENAEKAKQAKGFLNKLDKEQREIVILRIWEDMPFKEIASITGKSEAACKMSFSRAINSLKKEAVTFKEAHTY